MKSLLILLLCQWIMRILGTRFYNKQKRILLNYFSTIYTNFYIFFPYYIRISKTMLNNNGERSPPRLVQLTEVIPVFWPLR